MAAAERDPGRSPSCKTTPFSDAAQPVGPVGADSEREGLRSTKMASTKENIYGGTTDGLDASYDVASFVAFAKTRPLLSGILGAECVVGLLLGLWGLARLHWWGVLVGLLLTCLGVPALRFAVYSKDPKFRSGNGGCGPQCSCSPMCCGAGTVEGVIVFIAVVLLYVKYWCSGGPWPCPVDEINCLGGASTTTEFPPACTGNGYEIGCTRLVPWGEPAVGFGPHRVVCASECTNSSYCIKAVPGRGWCDGDDTMTPLMLPQTATVDEITPFVDAALDGMDGISVDENSAAGDCKIFRHMTVQSGFFGFLDDFWICVRKGTCADASIAGWEVLAQGQLRAGMGDIGQNFRHTEEFQEGVRAAANAAGMTPLDC